MKLLFRPNRLHQSVLAIWVLSLVLAVPQLFTQYALAQQNPALVEGVDAIGITVSDMDRAVDFYSKVLTFEKVSDTEVAGEIYEHLEGVFGLRIRVVRMRLGDEYIELTEYLTPKGRPIPADTRSNDRWFQHIAIIVSDMDRAYQWLRQHQVQHASTGPQRLPDWNPNAGGIQAFYFKDPDGHSLEVLAFPAGKGLAKWHNPGGRLFLGIDHTAIVVSDTERSLHFYRDTLGMRVAGSSENYGTEQEHLNNVLGAHLRITALRAQHGPGIEFLEYVTPAGGRPLPVDTQASDVWYWQINLCASQPAAFEFSLREAHWQLISGATQLPQAELGWHSGLITRDPDGHASLIGAGAACTRI